MDVYKLENGGYFLETNDSTLNMHTNSEYFEESMNDYENPNEN